MLQICLFASCKNMKGIFSILVAIVMLASGTTVSIDKHYCGGELAATKISVSGKLASCGMETVQHHNPNQPLIDNKCCDDQLTSYLISNIFLPEFPGLSCLTHSKIIPSVNECNIMFRGPDMAVNFTRMFPPGEKLKPAPALSEICVYRI